MNPYAKFGLDRPSRSAGHRQQTNRHYSETSPFFTQPPSGRRRMRICFADVFLHFFVFFSSVKNMRQPFLGTAKRIFMKLLPNDRGECSLKRRAAACRMLMICVIYDMTLSQSPEGATGGCIIQQ